MEISVIVYRRPNMFEVNDNLYNMMGYGELKNLFTIEHYKTNHEGLTLYFPERFLNIIEQRALVERAEKAGFKRLRIITHSVYIIQTVHHEYIGIVDDEMIEDGTSEWKLSNDGVGMPNDNSLGAVPGDGNLHLPKK